MSFLGRLFGAKAEPPSYPPLSLHSGDLAIPAVEFTAHGGQGDSWSRGYMLIGPQGGEYGHISELLSSAWMSQGVELVWVAGVTKKPKALASPAFGPGRMVRLVPEPSNRYDRNAIGVWDADGREQLGYIPRDTAAELAARIDGYAAMVLREAIDKAMGDRRGVKLILAPGLVVTPGPPAG